MGHVTLGGARLGSGNKMQVHLKDYQRSNHDLSYVWRSSMAAGTLVPFMSKLALPGDTWDIDLNADVKTHPTLGPLFGSFKLQLDIFKCPMRNYLGAIMQNTLEIGNNISQVIFPVITFQIPANTPFTGDYDNQYINPASILAYLGLRGPGNNVTAGTLPQNFNALPFISYWDIYKNYYANKQEEVGYYVSPPANTNTTVTSITVGGNTLQQSSAGTVRTLNAGTALTITYTGAAPDLSQMYVHSTTYGISIPFSSLATWPAPGSPWTSTSIKIPGNVDYWDFYPPNSTLGINSFPLSNIDSILGGCRKIDAGAFYTITSATAAPFGVPLGTQATGSQCGLGIKTYQSDLLNNWLQTNWLDNVTTGINFTTAVSTAAGNFQIQALVLARKMYDMLNRVALSGGTWVNWVEAVYSHKPYSACMFPEYMGGLSKEVVFDQIVSTAASNTGGNQPLGTLGGRGHMTSKHKGGKIHIKIDEPSYIIGIVSLTPRLDYSQGNNWDMRIYNMNDLHKPALDEIGFQNLTTELMAWWDTQITGGGPQFSAAGKQPAWLNYMTDFNKCYGNFAIRSNEMFMTLNRRYDANTGTGHIRDLTTYIDPTKFNYIFAQTDIGAQNFWTQIACEITARRKMSAKIMPNL